MTLHSIEIGSRPHMETYEAQNGLGPAQPPFTFLHLFFSMLRPQQPFFMNLNMKSSNPSVSRVLHSCGTAYRDFFLDISLASPAPSYHHLSWTVLSKQRHHYWHFVPSFMLYIIHSSLFTCICLSFSHQTADFLRGSTWLVLLNTLSPTINQCSLHER